MKLISNDLKEIGILLNKLRVDSYIDIYKETEFLSTGYLLDKDLNLYKYTDSLKFNEDTHNFGHFIELFKNSRKLDYNIVKTHLLEELNILEKEYEDDRTSELNTIELIKIDSSECEFNNSTLFEIIENKLLELSESER
ncbi:MAG: hypothetical protein IKQ35_03870 [Bacilli bacterium]|nr:hypothetical protein [Bacilli bacterium]